MITTGSPWKKQPQPLPQEQNRRSRSSMDVFEPRMRPRLEENIRPSYLKDPRRSGGKTRILQRVRVVDVLPLDREPDSARLIVLETAYTDGSPEEYLLPLAYATGEGAAQLLKEAPKAVLARLRVDGRDGVLHDAVYDEGFRANLLRLIAGKKRVRGSSGELDGQPGRTLHYIMKDTALPLPSQPLRVEQSNSSVQYGAKLHLKLYRRVEEGPNPDVEVSRFLTERAGFAAAPPFAGLIEYRRPGRDVTIVAQVQGYVPN